MSSDAVTALNNALGRLVKERQEREREVEKCQGEVDRAKVSAQEAERQAECAAYELRQVESDHNALLALYNNAIEKPQALLPQIDLLRGQQAAAFQKNELTKGLLRQKQQALRAAETNLGVAREAYEKKQGEWRELSDLLQREQNK